MATLLPSSPLTPTSKRQISVFVRMGAVDALLFQANDLILVGHLYLILFE